MDVGSLLGGVWDWYAYSVFLAVRVMLDVPREKGGGVLKLGVFMDGVCWREKSSSILEAAK